MDLTKYKDTQFYSGKPDSVVTDRLGFEHHNYTMSVRVVGEQVIASMQPGNCTWETEIDANNFVASVDAALEDAHDLGRSANWSNDE